MNKVLIESLPCFARFLQTTLWVLCLALASAATQAASYELLINKSTQELLIKDADRTIKKYRISIGSGGKGPKRQIGDKKTPIGTYHIVDFNHDSRFHLFMQLDYPNLLDAWYGYKNQTINAGEFKLIASAFKNKKAPPQNTRLGGFIGIHGIGDITDEKMMIHEGANWTEGCIALTNDEVEELKQYVGIGTRVVIKQ